MPFVSIIVPVYNAEKYIDRSVGSVLNQTDPDWELILIDDGSVDNSLRICNQLSKEDKRIRVISIKKNSGPATVRNIGIKAAIGRYLAFLDSDDTLDLATISSLRKTIGEDDQDIVWFTHREIYGNGKIVEVSHKCDHPRELNSLQATELFFRGIPGIGSMCNKLYSRDFVIANKLELNPDRVRAEDWEFNIMAFQKAGKVLMIPDCFYNYFRENSASVMATFREQDFKMMLRSISLQKEVAQKFNLDVSDGYYAKDYAYSFAEYSINASREKNALDLLDSMINSEDFQKVASRWRNAPVGKAYKVILLLLHHKLKRLAIFYSRNLNNLRK